MGRVTGFALRHAAGLAVGLAVTLAAFVLVAPAAQAAVDITIDKTAQIMTVAVDGEVRHRWPVSSGLPAYETPNGAFKAFRMEADHFSREWDDAPMPHSIFFTKRGHAIHGTDSLNRIGSPASHGCVRLSRDNAATLFALVEKQGVLNTTVTLTGSATVALARRKTGTAVASAAPADGARVSATENDTAPRRLAPPAAQGDGYQGYGTYDNPRYRDDMVYGVDQWGRLVAMRRNPRARQLDEARRYEQPFYGTRGSYYAPRRGLFGDGW